MLTFWKSWFRNRKLLKESRGDIELDQLGKIIIGVVVLIILIYIVGVVIKGEQDNQVEKLDGVFDFFK